MGCPYVATPRKASLECFVFEGKRKYIEQDLNVEIIRKISQKCCYSDLLVGRLVSPAFCPRTASPGTDLPESPYKAPSVSLIINI